MELTPSAGQTEVVQQGRLSAGETVAVFGCGGLGLSAEARPRPTWQRPRQVRGVQKLTCLPVAPVVLTVIRSKKRRSAEGVMSKGKYSTM